MRPSLSHRPVQGILDPKRRDYAGAFKALSHPAVAAQLRARNESLLLLGHAAHEPLRVPAGVWQHVQQLTGLPYKVGGPGGGGGGGDPRVCRALGQDAVAPAPAAAAAEGLAMSGCCSQGAALKEMPC